MTHKHAAETWYAYCIKSRNFLFAHTVQLAVTGMLLAGMFCFENAMVQSLYRTIEAGVSEEAAIVEAS